MIRTKYERWLVLPDIHLPYEDKRTMQALENYMVDVQKSRNPFVGWLQLGDLLDLDEISRWNEKYEASIKGDLANSFNAGNEFLDRHKSIMALSGKPFKMVLLQGNHDFRTVDFGKKYPHLSAHTNYERNLRLEEKGIEFVKCWEDGDLYQRGNAYFTHGKFLNKYSSFKMVDTFGVCVYSGHTHSVQEFSKSTWGNDKTLVGKSLGCLCAYEQTYMKGAPSNWQQAFAEFSFFKDGYFQEMTTKIFQHRFVGANGKVYQG